MARTVKKIETTPIKEALLEGARVVVIATVPLLIDGVTKWAVDWKSIAIIAIVTILRMVDKWAYESQKAGDTSLASKAKLPF